MIWLIWKVITLPVRLAFGTLGLAYKTVRFVGISRVLAFGAGVLAGLAIGPERAAEFRARLATGNPPGITPTTDLAVAVREELARAPRTWHLPQPNIAVDGGRVTLSGDAPHETARADLGRTAGSVIGVTAIDNQIVVVDAGDIDDGVSG